MSHVAPAAPQRCAPRAAISATPRQDLPDAPTAEPRIDVDPRRVLFRRVRHADDLRRVAHLREAIALPAGLRDMPAFTRLEQRRDRFGVVGAFECDGTVFGTVRVLPMNVGLAPCDGVLDRQPGVARGLLDGAWEVGRLVLAQRYRAGPQLLRRCLALTLLDMAAHAPVLNIFASCTPALARLYRRFGYSVLVHDVAGAAGREPYSLIHGRVAAVMAGVCDAAALAA